MKAYSDTDFAACPLTRRSTTGTLIMYNDAPIALQSKRQSHVCPSTHTAEYVAAFRSAMHLTTLRNFLYELSHAPTELTPLYIDNTASIATATAQFPTPHARHIDVKYHWIREQISQGIIIKPILISSNLNPADVFTKSLEPAQFTSKLPLLRLTAPATRGD